MSKKVTRDTATKAPAKSKPAYEPPRLMKFDKLEKLIVSGE